MKRRPVALFARLAAFLAIGVSGCGRGDSAHPPTPQVAGGDSLVARSNASAALVDTILVEPDSLVIHVGQSVHEGQLLKIEGRSASGQRIASFAPAMFVADNFVARFTTGGLTGISVGQTFINITAISFDPTLPAGRGRARVRVIVIP